jgi:RimJ/RimL family protein N-acetyltransferase
LNQQIFTSQAFHLEPIRDEDQLAIMNIRNEQLYHLRQSEPLTVQKQAEYFSTVVADLFRQEKPTQLLFSFFENGKFVGYGGLVHINWIDRHAEISFVMETALEKDKFASYWSSYLSLIEQVAFEALNLHKIFTYAFDVRPHLYEVLNTCGFREEARLKEHCYFDHQFVDVVYHAKINRKILFRVLQDSDVQLYFDWANDPSVRQNSYHSKTISLQEHTDWFNRKVKDPNCLMLLFFDHLEHPIGQVRIQSDEDQRAVIGISNDPLYRGKGYASIMIQKATDVFLKENPTTTILAYIKTQNQASVKAFESAGFKLTDTITYEGCLSYLYTKQL